MAANSGPVSREVASSIGYVLIKLASRCNYDCTYCYWFRDGSVRSLPATISPEVVDAFVAAVERHITAHRLSEFVCSFHGGEPTLFSVARFRAFLRALDAVGARTKCDIRYAITTNAALLKPAWIRTLVEFQVSVTVSLDGPPEVNDRRRITTKGGATWRETVRGFLALCRAGIQPSVIAVCDPSASAKAILNHFVRDLGVRFCDVLMPDSNHEEAPASIAQFYIELFDVWYDNYADDGVQVRILTDFMRGLLGLETRTESIGLAPTQTVCLSTDGSLEPHDVLRIAGADKVKTSSNILTHEIGAVTLDPAWRAVRDASTSLCETCLACRYKKACGGGHIAQRWSNERGYNNPSVYCSDLKSIFDHIAARLSEDVFVTRAGLPVPREIVLERLRSGQPVFT